MRIELVQIGNSQGIRLPKVVIEQAGLSKELELEVSSGGIVIRPVNKTRQGWAEAAKACRADGNDSLGEWDTTLGDFDGEWK
jgi:antitoxin MazE